MPSPQSGPAEPPTVKAVRIGKIGPIPNNPELPVLLYPTAFAGDADALTERMERTFRAHDWGGLWRNGIYDYHHYHSTAHEVLGISRGSARVQLGGEEGEVFELTAGDVLVLPAGIAHKNLGSSRDLLVVGAYPPGQQWDMNYGREQELAQARHNIAQVALPETDPLYGSNGPLIETWGCESSPEGK